MFYNPKADLDYALEFTRTYQSEENRDYREIACLKIQLPYVATPIAEDDLIVGGMKHGYVGLSPQYGGSYTYYFHEDRVREALGKLGGEADAAYREQIEEMCRYWATECTHYKMKKRFADRRGYPFNDHVHSYYGADRIAGLNVDLDLLVTAGIPGLHERVAEYGEKNGDSAFYRSLDMALDLLSDACNRYAASAEALMETASPERKAELAEIRENLLHIAAKKPQTFKQALQLVWMYAACSDLMNYGRMDNYLGDFYANDLEQGILDEEEAIRWLSSFYRHVIEVGKIHDSRILIGGVGRKHPEVANRLALVLIETSRRVKDVVPQLTLRYYSGMNEELMKKTLQNIQEGAVYPIVYSDDTVVPSVEKSYGIGREMAENWLPFGCGEYVIEGYGAGTPNTGATLPIILDVLLHRGVNSFTGKRETPDWGDPATFETFEQLFDAYDRMMQPIVEDMAYHEQYNYEVAGEEAGYLFASLLLHDCVEQGKAAFDGGVRYLCATCEIFGLITFADSLTAIKKRVYDEKRFTLPELIHMLDVNYEGYEEEHQLMVTAPKYGNDDEEADAMAVRVFHHIARMHEEAGSRTSLYRFKIVSVNNSGSAERGAITPATPCGRLKGVALSNGNSPSLGGDKNGLTATLNSMAKFDPADHVGVVHNIRFNRDMLRQNFDKIQTLLEVFFENNGVQANLSSIGKDELEDAMAHPEKYPNLLVRIGGFSARFVELSPIVQKELILRTTYENC